MSEWKIAPKAATWEMLDAALPHAMRESDEGDKSRARGLALMVWDAMLSAAPQPTERVMWSPLKQERGGIPYQTGASTSIASAPQPEQKPVAWMLKTGHGTKIVEVKPPCEVDLWKPLYLAPQPTEQEVCDLERQLSEALEREKALEDALQVAVDSELGAKWIWPDSAKETWMKNARELLSGDEPTYTDCPIHGTHEGDCPRC